MNERQTRHAISRISDSLSAYFDEVLHESPISDEFASRFKELVSANLDRMVGKRG